MNSKLSLSHGFKLWILTLLVVFIAGLSWGASKVQACHPDGYPPANTCPWGPTTAIDVTYPGGGWSWSGDETSPWYTGHVYINPDMVNEFLGGDGCGWNTILLNGNPIDPGGNYWWDLPYDGIYDATATCQSHTKSDFIDGRAFIKYDATPPTAAIYINGSPTNQGTYVGTSVSVQFTGSDATSGLQGGAVQYRVDCDPNSCGWQYIGANQSIT